MNNPLGDRKSMTFMSKLEVKKDVSEIPLLVCRYDMSPTTHHYRKITETKP